MKRTLVVALCMAGCQLEIGASNDAGAPDGNGLLDTDHDGDPDATDCAPMDPKIHHPIVDPNQPHYDPFPQSMNCCGYALGKSGADAHKSFDTDPICHAGSCGDGVSQDCSGADVACVHDRDCDTFPAMAAQSNGCNAPANVPSGNDCDDCNPGVNPGAAEICDGIDNNCNGLTDENCSTCDFDGDSFQRSDGNGCPDAKYRQDGKPVDCNDEDAGVFPISTSVQFMVKLPYLNGLLGSCGDKEGGTVCGALRANCRNQNPNGTAQDADCDGTAAKGCPLPSCDLDGDGYIDAAKAAQCDPNGQLVPYDCNDTDPHVFPNAPSLCGEIAPHNCFAIVNCGVDADADGYDNAHDCNDADKSVHPWAVERCNGVDDDCDGLTDEGNPDSTGAPMVSGGHALLCNDLGIDMCEPLVGHCLCSAVSTKQLIFDPPTRTACPGEGQSVDISDGSAPRCYGALQPVNGICM